MKHSFAAAAVFEFLISLDPPLDPEAIIPQLSVFADLLLTHAVRRNLLSASQRNEESVWTHILDSLQPLALKTFDESKQLLDAGSGGGLPGVPMAIATPETKVLLIERSGSKSNFLELAKALVPLLNVEVKCEDIESALQEQNTETMILSRAFMPADKWSDLAKTSNPKHSWVVFATDHNKNEWQVKAAELGLTVIASHEYVLPKTPGNKVLLHFQRA